MPVSKRRPPVNELLNNAVTQQTKLDETKTEILLRPSNIWLKEFKRQKGSGRDGKSFPNMGDNKRGLSIADFQFGSPNRSLSGKSITFRQGMRSLFQSNGEGGRTDDLQFLFFKLAVVVSLNCERILWYRWVRLIHICMWPIAFAVLAFEAPQIDESINTAEDYNFFIVDNIINSWFLVHGLVRVIGLFMRIKIEKAYQRTVTPLDAFVGSGVLQLVATILCFGYGISYGGLWIRLIRLALTTSTVLEVFPHINVLMSGVTHGLRSISYTVLVLFLLILCYASLGHYLFAANDPFHFGTYAQAALTFFQLSTFENWSTVYYINFMGCDSFPSEYSGNVGNINETISVRTPYGDFVLPLCFQPEARPVAASLVFVSFTILGGYVVISMCLATVAIGINERLQALRKLAVYGGDLGTSAQSSQSVPKAPAGAKASKLVGNIKEKALMKALLFKTWDEGAAPTMADIKRQQSFAVGTKRPDLIGDEQHDQGLQTFRLRLHQFMVSQLHDGGISCFIMADAAIQIYNEGVAYSSETFGLHAFIQSVFLLDFLLRFYDSGESKRTRFVMNFWNWFDLALGLVTIATLALEGNSAYDWLRVVRFIRLVRIMKFYSGVFGDLMVILSSLSNSFICVLYVLALLAVFFLLFAIAGVLLFRQANPYYFGSVVPALKTLLQVMTQDNWSSVMRVCMIGCRAYGNTGTPFIDNMCDEDITGMGVGWWGAAYFVTFMILSSMVLANLLVGVIISSMELLREGYKEETMVWENVRRIQTAYDIKADNIHRMLELWELLDKDSNGFLTFEETQPIMDLVNLKTFKQFELYMKCDMNKNGQINFHEFCELIVVLDTKRKDASNLEDPAVIAAALALQRQKKRPGTGGILASIQSGVSMRVRRGSVAVNRPLPVFKATTSGKSGTLRGVYVVAADGDDEGKVCSDTDQTTNDNSKSVPPPLAITPHPTHAPTVSPRNPPNSSAISPRVGFSNQLKGQQGSWKGGFLAHKERHGSHGKIAIKGIEPTAAHGTPDTEANEPKPVPVRRASSMFSSAIDLVGLGIKKMVQAGTEPPLTPTPTTRSGNGTGAPGAGADTGPGPGVGTFEGTGAHASTGVGGGTATAAGGAGCAEPHVGAGGTRGTGSTGGADLAVAAAAATLVLVDIQQDELVSSASTSPRAERANQQVSPGRLDDR